MKKYFIDRIFLGVLAVFFGIILQQSINMSRTASLMPKIFCATGIFLCFLVFVMGLYKERKEASKASGGEPSPSGGGGEKNKTEEKDWRTQGQDKGAGIPLYITAGAVIGYFILLLLLGFIISSIMVMFFMPFIMKYKKYVSSSIVAVVSTLTLFLTFKYIFHIALPSGLLFQALF